MKLFSRREKGRKHIYSGFIPGLLLTAAIMGMPGVLFPSGVLAFQLTDMARAAVSREPPAGPIDLVYRGYARLGLRVEAAFILERKIRLGVLSPEQATPLFEELTAEESRWNDPERLLTICDAAFRSGVRSPGILYSYGTAFRMSGRSSDASAMYAKIGEREFLYPYALYAMGQVAAEEGRYDAARNLFAKVQTIGNTQLAVPSLVRRATRSQAELLLATGKREESALRFKALLESDDNLLVKVGAYVSGEESNGGDIGLPEEYILAWPPRERILLNLMRGGIARERGRTGQAIDLLVRAREELEGLLSSPHPDSTQRFDIPEDLETVTRQVENHQRVRQLLSSRLPTDSEETIRSRIVELYMGLLYLDHSVARLQGNPPGLPADEKIPVGSRLRVEEVLQRTEEVFLDGVSVDRLVEILGKKLDILQNLAHPIGRYRLLAKLEKSQGKLRAIKARIQDLRKAALEDLSSKETPFRFLENIGRFLTELDDIREATSEQRGFTQRHFDILRKQENEAEYGNSPSARISDALEADDALFTALLPSVREFEEKARIASWEKEKRKLALLRPVVLRQLADAYVAHAESIFSGRPVQDHEAGWEALRRAASFLAGSSFESGDRVECAVNIASVLASGSGMLDPYPGKPMGEKELDLLGKILPGLEEGTRSTERREEALYLLALLRLKAGHPEGKRSAGEFLRKFPASPHAGVLAVRLGHDAILRGALKEAAEFYRKAAESPSREASDIGRFMIAWVQFQGGDSGGAIRELAAPLSNPSFRCDGPSRFEQSLLSLAVRSWQEASWKDLESYRPVAEGRCGGKSMLVLMGANEERRGRAVHAAEAYDILSRRFPRDEKALDFGKKSVEELLRAGEGGRAHARALSLEETFGPESEWANALSPEARERGRTELAEILKSVSERKFEEGIHSGSVTPMTEAKIGMERFFALKEAGQSEGDPDLRLKWGVASLRSGDREGGLAILQSLAERRTDSAGERAAVLLAETRIAGYERGEESAGTADNAVRLLLNRFPSEKSSGLAFRSAAAFLKNGEYLHAKTLAEEIERMGKAPQDTIAEVGLIHARSLLFLDELPSARAKADSVLAMLPERGDARLREGAADLVMLASLKEVEEKSALNEWKGAAEILEGLAMRFPENRQAGSFLMRAIESYRLAGDPESALRVGLRYMERFPRSEECVEIARTVVPYLLERKEYSRAAELFATTAGRFPGNSHSPLLLFEAARISSENGDREHGVRYFSEYRKRYPVPAWRKVFATLTIGMLRLEADGAGSALKELEAGIALMEKKVEEDAPRELFALAGNARIVLGVHWAEQFRKLGLVLPLEKSLAIKDRFFRSALASFEKAKNESPIEVSLRASQLSGDLYVDFGKAILDSQRPRELQGEERERYESGLRTRAQGLFERARDRYAEALDRLEQEQGPPGLAVPIRQSIQEAQRLLAQLATGKE